MTDLTIDDSRYWQQRNTETDGFDDLAQMRRARIAKYGSEHCPDCGAVYRCETWPEIVCEDHDCKTIPADKQLGM